MRVVHTHDGLDSARGGVFVPTMGALHEGHAALIREARRVRDAQSPRAPVVVSVFVNPTQFNQAADLARYPRTIEKDVEACERAGADVVFAPELATVYPPGGSVAVPNLPRVATEPGLEDAFRPGHFAGVCQVVKRLFELVRPRSAVFGEKDWQQLKVIETMTAEQGLDVEIVGMPTVREADGLAMSSRNVFLSADDRKRALALSKALCEAAGERTVEAAERRMATTLTSSGAGIEYAVVRDAESLMPSPESRPPDCTCRALIAARVGDVRLIDNAPWPG